MTTTSALINRVRVADAAMERDRAHLSIHAAQRQAAIRELVGMVGATQAADLLGIGKTAIYKATAR